MSLTMVLIPMAVAMSVTAAETVEEIKCKNCNRNEETLEQNLQMYSYQKVKSNISDYEEFQIEKEEILEDDSILITLTVE